MLINMVKTKLINIDSLIVSESSSISSPNDTDGVHTVGPQNIPKGMEEQALRFSLPLEAIKWDTEQIFKLAEMYNKKFNVHKYIWSYETKDKGDKENNPHLHCYLILPTQARSTKSDYITKVLHPFIRRDSKGRLMHTTEKEVLKLKSYQAYIVKDGKFISNFSNEEIEEIQNYDNEIKQDMKKSACNKLLDRIKELQDKKIKEWEKSTDENKSGNPPDIGDLNTICDIIINIYIFEWDKEPPLHKVKSQALYVGRKLGIKTALTEKILFWT